MQRLKQEQPMSEEGCGYDSKMDALKAFFWWRSRARTHILGKWMSWEKSKKLMISRLELEIHYWDDKCNHRGLTSKYLKRIRESYEKSSVRNRHRTLLSWLNWYSGYCDIAVE
jgi:hypothetical protein